MSQTYRPLPDVNGADPQPAARDAMSSATRLETRMSDPHEKKNEEHPTVEGTDPDISMGESPGKAQDAKAEDAEDDAAPSTEDPIDVEDLP